MQRGVDATGRRVRTHNEFEREMQRVGRSPRLGPEEKTKSVGSGVVGVDVPALAAFLGKRAKDGSTSYLGLFPETLQTDGEPLIIHHFAQTALSYPSTANFVLSAGLAKALVGAFVLSAGLARALVGVEFVEYCRNNRPSCSSGLGAV